MATKKKSTKKGTKKKTKATAGSISVFLVIAIILVVGMFVCPKIPALEGKVYQVELNVSKTEVTYSQGAQLNLTYDASYNYLKFVPKDLKEDVVIEYYDANGNKIDQIDTSTIGEYTVKYILKYQSVTKTVDVKVKVVGEIIYIFKDGDDVVDTKRLNEGEKVTSPVAPTKEGHRFLGWTVEGSDQIVTFPYSSNVNVVLTASWEEVKVITYTFKDDDTIVDTKKANEGESIASPTAPTKEGHRLIGWAVEGSDQPVAFPYQATDNVTLIAIWEESTEVSTSRLEFHFIDPTSAYVYAGDAIYIKAGDTDILIDAGPRQGSAGIIEQYVDQYCTDKKLEYVIATHADQDHIAGFVGTNAAPSIFEYYTCELFIDFPLSDKDLTTAKGNPTLYANYITKRDAAVANGMTYYTALECWNETNGASKVYELADGITMSILYNYFYEHKSSDENNYSVCVLFTETTTNTNYLFTGDLELKGEEYLVQYNSLPEVELFKAGHHGSPTSSNDCLLSVIKPKITVFTGVAGLDEYTKDIDRIFPSTFAINRLAKYTDKMYCLGAVRNGNYESLNGNVIVKLENGEVVVECTNNNTLLKDTWWFNSDVQYYNTTNSNGAVQMLLDNKHTTTDGTRKWRIWPE